MEKVNNIAILGGGEDELNILSEFHQNPEYNIIAIYDKNPKAVALEIAEIIGIPKFSDKSFISEFRKADYIIVTDKRRDYEEEINLLKQEKLKIINPSEAVTRLSMDDSGESSEALPWPAHLEVALEYIKRISDRGRLLKWLLEISVRSVGATSGSIMLHSEKAEELYIGYATGLSRNVIINTRQKIGEGIAGEVAESGISKLISDIHENQLDSRERERPLIISAISTPLVFENHLIGVLNVSTSRSEKLLVEDDVANIELLASKISPILEQHLRIETQNMRDTEYQIRSCLESLFRSEYGFYEKFTFLSSTLAEKLNADTVTIYTATDEGDWLILGGSAQHMLCADKAPRIYCSKGSLAKAYLNAEEVILTEAIHDTSLKIKANKDSITSIYLPLLHNKPLGVLVIEFSILAAMERFLQLKDTLSFQVGFFVHSQLKDLDQFRKIKGYEDLSALTPLVMGLESNADRLKQIPGILSSLLNASMGSFFFSNGEMESINYFKFPDDELNSKSRIEYDDEIRKRTLELDKPETIGFLPKNIDTYKEIPAYLSVISYPFRVEGDFTAVYNGYNKVPQSPLDSSIFGHHELMILDKIRDILLPILKKTTTAPDEKSLSGFQGLLKSNQKIFLDRINEEIERANRYHHGIALTLFKIHGLAGYYKISSDHALELVNNLSIGLRKEVRKTDYFSWIEIDIFGIISLESYQKTSDLEKRIIENIDSQLKKKGLFDSERFYADSACTLYPGAEETAPELITKVKSKLK